MSQDHRNHFLLKDLPTSFLGINPTGWVLHPVSLMNPAKRFKVLAVDENRMSQVIATDSVFGTLFPILKKYHNTITIAQNFVRHTIKSILAGYEQSKMSIFVDWPD